jgi:hypothetical protein
MKKILRNALKCLTICFVFSSCAELEKIKYDPKFYAANSKHQHIANRDGHKIKASSSRFDEFACLHKNKIKELVAILKAARIPKKYRKILDQELSKIQGNLNTAVKRSMEASRNKQGR